MKIKALLTYLALVAISVLFMLYLDGPGGSYLVIVLALAAVISVAVCIYTRLAVSAELVSSEDILNKKDIVRLTVSVKKHGILPSAILEAQFCASYHLKARSPLNVKGVCTGRNECVFQAEFSAEYFGKAKLGLSSFYVSDYLGLCRFRVPLAASMLDVRVYPDVPDVSRKDGFARSIADAAAFDDSEETTNSTISFQGTPGYEHRLYEPGDSLKLINWKLSAKRDDLYVRRLEGASGAEQLFILDKMGGDREPEQLAAEAMLGLIAQLVRSELPIKLFMRFSDVWEEISVTDMTGLAELRHRMTDFSFLPEGVNRFPESIPGGRAIVFSPCAENGLVSYIETARAAGKECSAAVGGVTVPSPHIWRIVKDNSVISFVS